MAWGQVGAAARRHWLMAALLAAGLALRVMAQTAYRPALFYIDSIKYLFGAYPGNDPPGYELLLRWFLPVGNLEAVAAVQHLLGLAMAVAIYLLLLRRAAPRVLAALAAAPVLLDGYQLQLEQTIMPDVLFEALIVAGLAFLLWRPRPRPWMIAAGAFALGASATVRQVGEILILPALIYVLLAIPGWCRRFALAGVAVAAFALPILAIMYRNYVSPLGRFSLAPYAASTIYGRMAAAADCATIKLPAYERPLCPTPAQMRQLGGPDNLDHHAGSPIKGYQPPPGIHRNQAISDFSHRVLIQQPLRVLGAVGHDAIKLFAVTRVTSHGDTPISRWQFQAHYPTYPPYVTTQGGHVEFADLTTGGLVHVLGTGQHFHSGGPAVSTPLASFLRAYQLDGGYTPGPALAFCALAGLAASIAALLPAIRRRHQAALACLLFFASAAAVLLVSDAFEFSWRYQLPAVITLPPAGALALTLAIRGRTRRRTAPATGGLPAGAAAPGRSGAGEQPAPRGEKAVASDTCAPAAPPGADGAGGDTSPAGGENSGAAENDTSPGRNVTAGEDRLTDEEEATAKENGAAAASGEAPAARSSSPAEAETETPAPARARGAGANGSAPAPTQRDPAAAG